MSKRLQKGDEGNRGLGLPEKVVHLKPGLDAKHTELEIGKNHRRKPSEPKSIPQGPIAERIRSSRKGE